MKSFQYCIWALPEKGNEWYNYPNGYYPHITIKSNLSLDEAFLYFEKNHFEQTDIIVEDFNTSLSGGFSALYANVKYVDEKPIWWPDNAHVSFCYKYTEPFTKEHLEYYTKNMPIKKVKIKEFLLVRCDGHFMDWKNQILSRQYDRHSIF